MANHTQINLKIDIDTNRLEDLQNLTTLIREGWNLMHIGDSDAKAKDNGQNTKVVLIRKMS